MSTTTYASYLSIADSIVSGPVPVEPFVPNSANLFPKMTDRINDSAWELWQFDAFSVDGETAVSVSFYRDARSLKEGGFHVDLNAIWPDGSKWGKELYFPESTITASGGPPQAANVHGVWRSEDTSNAAEPSSAEFRVASDLSTAFARFSVPGSVAGTIELHSRGGDRQFRLPATQNDALLGTDVYYLFPMGPTTATANLMFEIHGEEGGDPRHRTLSVQASEGGHGGMVRGWSALAWPKILTDAYYICATAGPYMMQLLRIVSSDAASAAPYVVARLYRNEELVCASQNISDAKGLADGPPEQDMVIVEKVVDPEGGLAGAFRDGNTGYLIEYVKGGAGDRWRFNVRHKMAWWSSPTSKPGPDGTGKSGFVEAVFGGSDDEAGCGGAGVAGQLQLP